jgi:hypothetical protein
VYVPLCGITETGLIRLTEKELHFSSLFVEIIGKVIDSNTLDFIRCVNMGDSLGKVHIQTMAGSILMDESDGAALVRVDLARVNKCIELSFDPRYSDKMFSIPLPSVPHVSTKK